MGSADDEHTSPNESEENTFTQRALHYFTERFDHCLNGQLIPLGALEARSKTITTTQPPPNSDLKVQISQPPSFTLWLQDLIYHRKGLEIHDSRAHFDHNADSATDPMIHASSQIECEQMTLMLHSIATIFGALQFKHNRA